MTHGKSFVVARWPAFTLVLAVMLLLQYAYAHAHPPRALPAPPPPGGLQDRVAALEELLQNLSRNANGDLVLTGANLYIQSGSGATDGPINGKGNLIIGYDEDNGDDKSGSHNLIVGKWHSYSSYGGLVVGFNNLISGIYSSVSGGSGNEASGSVSSVSGGNANIACGTLSSVSGGEDNFASSDRSSVSGGRTNIASGDRSSVSGGSFNEASGDRSSVSGGCGQTADETCEHVP